MNYDQDQMMGQMMTYNDRTDYPSMLGLIFTSTTLLQYLKSLNQNSLKSIVIVV